MRRVRDMLGDGSQEVGGGEDLEVAVDQRLADYVALDEGRGIDRAFLLAALSRLSFIDLRSADIVHAKPRR